VQDTTALLSMSGVKVDYSAWNEWEEGRLMHSAGMCEGKTTVHIDLDSWSWTAGSSAE
jgi:hypothetical protein